MKGSVFSRKNTSDLKEQIRRPTVLVVDDEPPIRRALRRLLSRAGYEVVEAEDGDQALRQLEEGPSPDLVTLDLQMPGTGGELVLKQLARKHPELPVVVVSGKLNERLIERLLAEGARACVDKPRIDRFLLPLIRRLTSVADRTE